MFTNRTRMTGFSGIDVADMVNQMMRAESMRLDRLRQNRDIMVWQQAQMRQITTNVRQFQNQFLNIAGANGATSIRRPENFNALRTTITPGTAGQTGLTVTAGPNAAPGSHNVTVTQAAQAHALRSAAGVNHNQGISSTAIDFRAFMDFGNPNASPPVAPTNDVVGGSFRMTVNGVVRNVHISSATLIASFGQSAFDDVRAAQDAFQAAWGTFAADNETAIDTETATRLAAWQTENPSATPEQITRQETEIRTQVENEMRTAFSNTHEAAMQTRFANMMNSTTNPDLNEARFINDLNQTLRQEFGFNAGPQTPENSRVFATFTNGELTIRARDGNTASIQNGIGNNAVNIFQLGFTDQRNLSTMTTAMVPATTTLASFLGSSSDTSFVINGHRFDFTNMDNTGGTITVTNTITNAETEIHVTGREVNINDVMNAINNSGAGVRMTFSQNSGQFHLDATQTGEAAEIRFEAGDNAFLNRAFGVNVMTADMDSDPSNTNNIQFRAAQNAVVNVNGAEISRETNNFTVGDLQISLSQGVQSGASFTVEVERNLDGVRDLVNGFIEGWNNLIRSITDLTEARRPRSRGNFFMPLTEEQRRGMSDREVQEWEEQAMTGILNRDPTLRALMNEMRNALFANVYDGQGGRVNLAMIGIRSVEDLSGFGMIEIRDEAIFENFLQNNPQAIVNLFVPDFVARSEFPDTPEGQREWWGRQGLGDRLNSITGRALSISVSGSLADRAGIPGLNDATNVMSRQLNDQERRIDNMLSWLERREEQLFAQFSRLEVAMMQANSQMMFFEQMFWM